MAIFISPKEGEITTTTQLLQSFRNVSGLQTNFQKNTVLPIRCDHNDLDTILQDFPTIRSTFPTKYLGLPLTCKILRRVDFQPLVGKVGGRLAGWQVKLLTPVGRTTLVKSVLMSIPVYFLTVLIAPKGIVRALDRSRRRFLWTGQEDISGGKCKSCLEVCRPTQLWGLSLLNLQKFASALKLRWPW